MLSNALIKKLRVSHAKKEWALFRILENILTTLPWLGLQGKTEIVLGSGTNNNLEALNRKKINTYINLIWYEINNN